MQLSWSRSLARPLTLRNGTVLRTLRDARHFIAMLPEDDLRRPTWKHAAQLLWDAAKCDRACHLIEQATLLMQRALKAERR